MPSDSSHNTNKTDENGAALGGLFGEQPTKSDQQIEELQEDLTEERDARKEERFIFIVAVVLLLDIVFFTVMPTFGGPLALLILELLILIPLARRMGMEEIAAIVSRVLDNVASKPKSSEDP